MTIQQRWSVLVCSVVVCAALLGGVFVFGSFETHRRERKAMNTTRISVDHVRLATEKPFDEVTSAFERQLGRFDPDVYKALAEGGDAEGARVKIEAMGGPSGFMLFSTNDHGS